MLCKDVRRVVYFFLDGSLGDRKLVEFQTHLRICRSCDDRTSLHRRLRDFIRKRLSPVSAPEHFKIRLTQSIRTIRAE